MKYLTLLLIALSLTGCATWPTETRMEETAFMTLHAVDGLQTSNIHNVNCGGQIGCHEVESSWAIGCEPSARSTAAFFAATAVLHFAVTDLMVNMHAKPWMLRTWEGVSIGWGAYDVAKNAELGIPVRASR